MIKTILVPIDGSEHAQKAVELAGDIAGKYDAKVKLLYVRPEGPLPESLRHLAAVEYGLQSRPETPPGQPTTVLRPSDGGDAEISRKLGDKLRKAVDQLDLVPPRTEVVRQLSTGLAVNFVGLGATIVGIQATTGLLFAKSLSAAGRSPTASSTSRSRLPPISSFVSRLSLVSTLGMCSSLL